MKVRISKIDLVTMVLIALLAGVEFYLTREHMLGSAEILMYVAIGLVIGVNLGFKLASMHSIRVSEKVFGIAETCEGKLVNAEQKQKETERELEIALERERRLRQALETSLKERDEEVRYLITKLKN